MQELYFEAYNIVNGTLDIFYSSWNTHTSQWRIRRPLPTHISDLNYDERHPFISRDGNTIYYDTNRPGGQGDYDVWTSRRIKGYWLNPMPIYAPINSSAYEAAPYVSYFPGGKQLYFETTRSGDNELFVSDWDIIKSQWSPPKRMCLDFISSLHPSINTTASELLYHSIGGLGDYDIWISECLPTPTPTGTWYSPTPTATPTPYIPVNDVGIVSVILLVLIMSMCGVRRFW
jgi:hypothetical protein